MKLPRTKIVATLGPASTTAETVVRLVEAGVSVFRLNFSHGTQEQKRTYISAIRGATSRPLAIMADLCGPKIRLGQVEHDAMAVVVGDTVTIQRAAIAGREYTLSSNYAGLVDDLEIGQRVLIDDGAIRMLVTEKFADCVRCQVTHGGVIRSNKGINLPGTHVNIPGITDRDWTDAAFAVETGLDYIALSFVRSAADVQQLRAFIKARGGSQHIISKIEMPEAVEDIASIVDASDAVLVARGDLGVEMDLTAVPLIQKEIVHACHDAAKPCIVATQMLQSMVDNPTPTRAEVSDVANAIMDGADAVMLSGETAVGKYPVGAVHVLTEIAGKTEEYRIKKGMVTPPPRLLQAAYHRTAALAHGARDVVADIDAKLVFVWSQAGGSARYLSKYRLGVPIVAFSSDPSAVRRMALYRGVTPLVAPIPAHYDDLPALVDRIAAEHGLASPGDRVVLLAGAPLGIVGVTNALSVHTIGKQ